MAAGAQPAAFQAHFMKRSGKPTKYLLLRAGTYSEWDSCDFAVLEISLEGFSNYEKWLAQVSRIERDYCFSFLAYYDPRITFYRNSERVNAEEILDGKNAVFIKISNAALENLATPETKMDGEKMKIYSQHAACFSAYGEYTNEEFYTAEFDLAQLIEDARTLFPVILKLLP